MSRAIFFITGSSGAGKTTLLRRIYKQLAPVAAYHHFDEAETKDFKTWLEHVVAGGAALNVLDASKSPTDLQAAVQALGIDKLNIVLIDCGHRERKRRLVKERNQPELDTLDIYAWAAYLRGQADALGLEVIDTTSASLEQSSRELLASIERFRLELS